MKKNYFYLTCLAVFATLASLAQRPTKGMVAMPEEKRFNNLQAGDATISAKRTELVNGVPTCTYDLLVPITGLYSLQVLAPLHTGQRILLSIDGNQAGALINNGLGWQLTEANFSNTGRQVMLHSGKHQLRFSSGDNQYPTIDQWSLSISGKDAVLEQHWIKLNAQLQRMAAQQPASNKAVDKTVAASGSANKVLPNPAGTYTHQVDETFAYTTFQWYYFNAGETVTLETKSSTVDPVMHLFNPYNVDAGSWAQDDFGGTWESKLTVNIVASGNYCLMVRPYTSGASGTTNIYKDGVLFIATTPIGGKLFYNNGTNTGDLNFFTCQLTGTNPDTRIFTLNTLGGAFTGYNDDYPTAGDYYWGRQSRIKKNFAVKPSYAFVCAYGTGNTGTADTYMGCLNSNVYNYFVNLKQDDAIEAAPSTGDYNCISWSGGITTAWSWPIDNMSVYYLAGNPLGSFDRFYCNTPVKRYSGATNYTRNGATQTNSIVDLWAYNGSYTHGSVRKTGNGHPHGYDWESKPGNTARTFHPRYGLNGAAPSYYGDVVNYYIPTGTFAPRLAGTGALGSDKEAIDAGFDVADKAALSPEANSKLEQMQARVSATTNQDFDKLYNAWQASWQANQIQSDPMRYYQNPEGEALLAYCKTSQEAVLPLVLSRYLQGNAICNHLLSVITIEKYGKLLEEVKNEYLANPYDKQGRFIVNNSYCNGIRYIEKILRDGKVIAPLAAMPVDPFTVQIAPNPVQEAFNIQVDIKKTSTVSIQLLNTQTGATKMVKKAIILLAGTYRFAADIRNMNFVPGSLLAVQVTVNGVTNSYKVITTQ